MTDTTDPTTPVDAAEGPVGSQLLAPRQSDLDPRPGWSPQTRAAVEDLEEVAALVDHGEATHNPEALRALRAADQLQRELAVVTADRDRARLDGRDARGWLMTATIERDAARSELVTAEQRADRAEAELGRLRRHVDLCDRVLATADEAADRWRRKHDETRAELERVGARAGWASLLAVQLRMLAQAVDQAIDDYQPLSARWRAVPAAARQARSALAAFERAEGVDRG